MSPFPQVPAEPRCVSDVSDHILVCVRMCAFPYVVSGEGEEGRMDVGCSELFLYWIAAHRQSSTAIVWVLLSMPSSESQ